MMMVNLCLLNCLKMCSHVKIWLQHCSECWLWGSIAGGYCCTLNAFVWYLKDSKSPKFIGNCKHTPPLCFKTMTDGREVYPVHFFYTGKVNVCAAIIDYTAGLLPFIRTWHSCEIVWVMYSKLYLVLKDMLPWHSSTLTAVGRMAALSLFTKETDWISCYKHGGCEKLRVNYTSASRGWRRLCCHAPPPQNPTRTSKNFRPRVGSTWTIRVVIGRLH